MPDVHGFARHKVKTLQVGSVLSNFPDPRRLLLSLAQRLGEVELIQAVHAAKCVDGIELAIANPQPLGKAHRLRVTKNTITDHLVSLDLIAMDPQVAHVANPEMLAVPANRVDPGNVTSDVPGLDDLQVAGPNLGND